MKPSTFTIGLLSAHPQNAARTLESFPAEDLAELLVQLPPGVSAVVVRELSPALAAACLACCADKQAAEIIRYMDIDMAALILRRLDKEQRHAVVHQLPASNWIGLRMVLRYPSDTVGSMLDPNVLSVHKEMPVSNVLKNMRLFKDQLLHAVYVTERNHVFAGSLDVRDLFFTDERRLAGELAHKPDVCITARTTLSNIYHDDLWAGQSELPVVDHNRRFLGVLHHDSLNKALEHMSRGHNGNSGLTETALALSELIWSACAGIFSGVSDTRNSADTTKRENPDER